MFCVNPPNKYNLNGREVAFEKKKNGKKYWMTQKTKKSSGKKLKC